MHCIVKIPVNHVPTQICTLNGAKVVFFCDVGTKNGKRLTRILQILLIYAQIWAFLAVLSCFDGPFPKPA